MQDETQKPRKEGPDRSKGLGGKISDRNKVKGGRRNGVETDSKGRSAQYEGIETRPRVQIGSGAEGMRACLDISLQSGGRPYRIGSMMGNGWEERHLRDGNMWQAV